MVHVCEQGYHRASMCMRPCGECWFAGALFSNIRTLAVPSSKAMRYCATTFERRQKIFIPARTQIQPLLLHVQLE